MQTTIKYLNQTRVFSASYPNGAYPHTVGFILPVNANSVTVTVAQRFRLNLQGCKLMFITDDDFRIQRTYNGEVGDQTFLFDRPIRYIHWTHQAYDYSEFNLSKIAWSTV